LIDQVASFWPQYSKEEGEAVKRVLMSNLVNYWTGSEVTSFEREFSEYFQVKYSVAVANGTLALEAALRALEIKPGDEVVVSARSFIASASSIVNVGAIPVFADIDRATQNITASSIQAVLSPKTRAVVCVHLAGWPCDMDPIVDLCKSKAIFVVEDCAQAHGALYKGRNVGSLGDIAAWSFCQDKIITTGGEGGMVTTNSEELWDRVWSYKDHGKSRSAIFSSSVTHGYRWVHHSIGSNFRLTEMQAAIGRIQLKKLHDWGIKRRNNAERIWSLAEKSDLFRAPKHHCSSICSSRSPCVHAAYNAYIFVNEDKISRDVILEMLIDKKIPVRVGSCPEIYRERAFRKQQYFVNYRLPVAEELGRTSLMFPCHPALSDVEIDHIIDSLESVAHP